MRTHQTTYPLVALAVVIPALLSACTQQGATEEVSKADARSAAANGKADDLYLGGDYCEAWGWYGDMECDDFCPAPDPDCDVCRLPGDACAEADCGPRPELSPRPCSDGSFIYGSVECVDVGGTCDWEFEAPECPIPPPGAPCDEIHCGAAPSFSSRVCCDGSTVAPPASCVVDSIGTACEWVAGTAHCI